MRQLLPERFITFLAPHDCLGCAREGSLLCAWCQADLLSEPRPERCYKCLVARPANLTCSQCRRTSKLKHVWVASDYEGTPKALVQMAKFHRARAAIEPMALTIQDRLPYLDASVIITHVPTATSRIRWRGFDQAELLARELAQVMNLHYVPLLARRGQSRQVGASRAERHAQLATAFRPLRSYLAPKTHILLVDDVLTTGATLEAAAATLKRAGAQTVDATVFAQKQ